MAGLILVILGEISWTERRTYPTQLSAHKYRVPTVLIWPTELVALCVSAAGGGVLGIGQ